MAWWHCIVTVTCALSAAAPAVAANSACEAFLDGQPLLSQERVEIAAGKPLLLHVQQHDRDVAVIVHQGEQRTEHNGPSGRNGAEWIYATAATPGIVELCIYASGKQGSDPSHTLTRVDLSSLSAAERHALRSMSEAGIRWPEQTQAARSNAIQLYDAAASAHVSLLHASNHAALYAQLGRMQLLEYDAALRGLAVLIAPADPADYVTYMARWATGNILNRRRQWTDSQRALRDSLTALKAHEARTGRRLLRDQADITNLLGETHLSTGDLAAGEFLIHSAKLLCGDDPQLLGFIHSNLGYLYLLQANKGSERAQRLSQSLAEHLKARQYLSLAHDSRSMSILENNLGSVYERLGHLRKARAHYEEALRLIDGTHDPFRFQVLYWNLGNIYQYLGDHAKAERYLAEAFSLAQQVLPQDAIRLRCALATTLRMTGRITQAIEEHKECRAAATTAKLARIEAEACYELTLDYRAQARSAEAWSSIQAAMQLLERIESADLHAKILTQRAELLQQRGEEAAARDSIDAAIRVSLTARFPTVHIDALSSALLINARQGREADALRFGLQAVEAIQSVHAHLDAERLGPAWSTQTRAIYEQLALLVLARFERNPQATTLRELLLILERSRAIGLRQQFSAAPSLVQQVEGSHTLAALSTLANEQARRSDETGRTSMPLAYYHEHDLLTRSRLAGVDNLPVPPPLPVDRLQRSLAGDQLALYYFAASERTYLIAITRAALTLRDLGPTKHIEALVVEARDATAQQRQASFEALRRLSRVILPLSSLPQARHWIVVADGALHTVPFAALDLGTAQNSYDPAMRQHSIRLVPSLSAYWMQKQHAPKHYSADIAVFANPVVGEVRDAVVAGNGKRGGQTAGWTQELPPLLWTAKEAEHLRSIFGPERTLLYTDKRATRFNLRSVAVRDARILHLASHGYFNSNNPDNVGLALSGENGEPGFDSGFVTLSELFTYRFNNELVVISGCDSAMGLEQAGEGMLSIARGFIAQGASHAVSTLWAVSDRASAEFMRRFYTHIATGEPISQALQRAQQELRTETPYQHPFFWGAYVLASVDPSDSVGLAIRSTAARQ